MIFKIIVILVYVSIILFVGIKGLKGTKSFSDYFLGGGKIGAWMTAFTYGAAYFSAVLFIGFAGKIGWSFGYSGLWIALGNAFVGVLAVWWLVGPRIKKMSTEYGVHTMPEFFEKRYESKPYKLFSSIVIFVFFIPYSAAVFMGLSFLFKATFGIEYTYALLFMGFFTALYLVMGGYKSMTMIDVVFGIIMTVGVLVLFFTTIGTAGGLENITNGLSSIDPKLTEVIGPPGWWPLLSLVILTSAAPFAMPQLVQKFYAIKDNHSIKIGMIASTLFAILVGGIAYFTGSATRYFLTPENNPAAFADGKPIFDALMPELLVNVIPNTLSILILLLILSASMSTLAALILISSSSVAKDIYAGFINKNVSDRKLTLLMRTCSGLFVLISVILAYFKPATIVSILGISWGAIGSVFLGPFVWGLFTKRIHKFSAIASSIISLSVCLYLYFTGMPSPEAGSIGMIISFVSVPILSFIIPQK